MRHQDIHQQYRERYALGHIRVCPEQNSKYTAAAGEDDLEEVPRLSMRAAEKRVMTALAQEFSFASLFPESKEP